MLLIKVLAMIGFSSIIEQALSQCSINNMRICQTSQICTWRTDLDACVSSVPCVLEFTESNCAMNTWGCTWSKNLCAKTIRKVLSPDLCASLDPLSCGGQTNCMVRNGTCQLRPTIIVSLADDLGYYDVGWKNPRSRTPVLSALRSYGVDLDRHYTARFCAPSRATILSGRLPWRLGLQTDLNLHPVEVLRCASSPGTTLLPGLLKQGGYATHAFGKWHLGAYREDAIPTARGFDTYLGYYSGGIQDQSPPDPFFSTRCACPGHYKGTCHTNANGIPFVCALAMNIINVTAGGQSVVLQDANVNQATADLLFAEYAADTIVRTDDNTPLFLYLAWSTPHEPVYAPESYQEQLVASVPAFGTDAPLLQSCPAIGRLTHLAMVSMLDEAHRVVIDALDYSGRFESTIFLFLSDNGGHSPKRNTQRKVNFCGTGSNYPLRGSKYTYFEGGIRGISFLSSFKYINPSKWGSTSVGLISEVDWKLTLVSASGLSTDSSGAEDGIDMWGALSGAAGAGINSRVELAEQVWLEEKRFVILFYYEGSLYKVIQGYPWSGLVSGIVGTPIPGYAHAEIDQPMELPLDEVTYPLDSGYNSIYQCDPYCLFDLDADPQEFNDLSISNPDVMTYAKGLISKYRSEGVLVADSGLCESGYWPSAKKVTTDSYSMVLAKSCGGFLPWLNVDGSYKALCSSSGDKKMKSKKKIEMKP